MLMRSLAAGMFLLSTSYAIADDTIPEDELSRSVMALNKALAEAGDQMPRKLFGPGKKAIKEVTDENERLFEEQGWNYEAVKSDGEDGASNAADGYVSYISKLYDQTAGGAPEIEGEKAKEMDGPNGESDDSATWWQRSLVVVRSRLQSGISGLDD